MTEGPPDTPPIVQSNGSTPWWKRKGCLAGCGGALGLLLVIGVGGLIWENFTESGQRYRAEQDSVALADSLAKIERAREDSLEAIAEARQDSIEKVEREQESRRVEAKIMCEEFVQDRLVSPASADFPTLDFTGSCTGTECVINSHVDAENRFGAKIRINYRCVVNETSEDRWNLLDIQMNER